MAARIRVETGGGSISPLFAERTSARLPNSEAGVRSCVAPGFSRTLLLDAIGRPRAPLRAEVFTGQALRDGRAS